jgi:hypothetical protein
MYGMKQITKESCIKNIEIYTKKTILPKEPEFFYYWSGIVTTWYREFDWTGLIESKRIYFKLIYSWNSLLIIKDQLDKMIQIWIRTQNYLGFFTNEAFLQELQKT